MPEVVLNLPSRRKFAPEQRHMVRWIHSGSSPPSQSKAPWQESPHSSYPMQSHRKGQAGALVTCECMDPKISETFPNSLCCSKTPLIAHPLLAALECCEHQYRCALAFCSRGGTSKPEKVRRVSIFPLVQAHYRRERRKVMTASLFVGDKAGHDCDIDTVIGGRS